MIDTAPMPPPAAPRASAKALFSSGSGSLLWIFASILTAPNEATDADGPTMASMSAVSLIVAVAKAPETPNTERFATIADALAVFSPCA